MLKLKNIVKNYYPGENIVEALKGVNLEFRKSDFVSILGPSGCGKTTLLNIIGGLDRYTSGDLIINGRSTKNFTDSDWDSYRNHSIGFVFQNYNLISHLTVLRNVELALTLSGVSAAERKHRATEALEKVGLGDQLYKKPNQLSGGQMQRVAIARALVNNPDILLADEPTGALDTQTSSQIMEILHEIAKERLIIMVTHNSAIAFKYSTRIIKLLDGKVIDDTNPYTSTIVEVKTEKPKKIKKPQINKTSMSFVTALSLSFRNLITKKARTILTAFAGSIGIIGIALVLALSNGFTNYIDKMQTDMLSSYPLTISQSAIDFDRLISINRGTELPKYPTDKIIKINKILEISSSATIRNDITQDYIDNVVEKIDRNLYNAISYQYGVRMNIFRETTFGPTTLYQRMSSNSWTELMEDEELSDKYQFVKSQYDVLHGRLPENKNEIVIVVDMYNQLTDYDLIQLGLYTNPNVETLQFDDLIGQKYRFILNDDLYTFDGTKFTPKTFNSSGYTFVPEEVYNSVDSINLEIVGIIRVNEETSRGSINSTIGYSKELTKFVLDEGRTSEIVTWMNQQENLEKDPLTGVGYIAQDKTVGELRYNQLISFGGLTVPTQINIYPVDFNAKDQIKKYLDDYNNTVSVQAISNYYSNLGITPEQATKEQQKTAEAVGKAAGVYYTDLIQTLVSSINKIINSISYVLIAFTAVSLVVSSIMIGIITYISVLERTKEIGILRSIGARKKDISRVFNAETIIIGFAAGLFGVVVTALMTIPINLILNSLVEARNLAQLNIIHAFVLIVISIGLTLIAGIIPSRIAANRDPVVALRTE